VAAFLLTRWRRFHLPVRLALLTAFAVLAVAAFAGAVVWTDRVGFYARPAAASAAAAEPRVIVHRQLLDGTATLAATPAVAHVRRTFALDLTVCGPAATACAVPAGARPGWTRGRVYAMLRADNPDQVVIGPRRRQPNPLADQRAVAHSRWNITPARPGPLRLRIEFLTYGRSGVQTGQVLEVVVPVRDTPTGWLLRGVRAVTTFLTGPLGWATAVAVLLGAYLAYRRNARTAQARPGPRGTA
jgi:hypothetical protein